VLSTIFFLVNLVGGILVLSSYAWGLWAFPFHRHLIWGDIGVSTQKFIVPFMFLAAIGYIVSAYWFWKIVPPNDFLGYAEDVLHHIDLIPVEFEYNICTPMLGNMNGDISAGADGVPGTNDAGEGDDVFNVLDIVILANCILYGGCEDLEYACAGYLNSDEYINVYDLVVLSNCIMAGNCGD